MNLLTKFSVLGFSVALILSSCTMEKRQYMSGYHIDWHNKKQKVDKVAFTNEIKTPLENSAIVNVEIEDEIFSEVETKSTSIQLSIPLEKNVIKSTNAQVLYASTDELTSYSPKVAHKNVFQENMDSFNEKNILLDDNQASEERSSGKSQVIALVLAALVGVLGVHRFYLGYIGIGVAQLLTFGGCGVWALIDLIRIITGDLKPKNGRYSKTL